MTSIGEENLKNSRAEYEGASWNKRTFLLNGEEYTHDQIGENIVLQNLQEFMKTTTGLLYDLEAEVFSVTVN